jgi:ubiquinol-cytochrome c reductase cytochrome c subunit
MTRLRAALLGAVGLALAVAWLTVASVVADDSAAAEAGSVERGADLFATSCSTCHGEAGGGTSIAPALIGVGAAAPDFMLRTGRMPLADSPDAQAIRKPPAFDEQSIRDLVAYVASLGEGPAIPDVSTDAPVDRGMALFVANCAPCHGVTGAGGAVGGGDLAPSLDRATPRLVGEAMLIGPGQMPVFDYPEDEVDAIATYVEHLHTAGSPGGFSIGNIGPVPEGFVAWLLGMGALGLVAYLVGRDWSGHRT